MFRKILVLADASKLSRKALKEAIEMAKVTSASIALDADDRLRREVIQKSNAERRTLNAAARI